MSASGPNIQLELRLAEMARMNEEIRRRHSEVEADKRRAQRTGGMVSRDQSITMATAMPNDFDATREDGFKDGLDSRPLPADPYGKDRVPRDKRGKPQDKNINKKNYKKPTIDEARQRGMADQEFWRQEQARADAARIKRAQGRDGTWRREWDREKNHGDERENSYRSRGDKGGSRDKGGYGRGGSQGSSGRRHETAVGGRYGNRRGENRRKNHSGSGLFDRGEPRSERGEFPIRNRRAGAENEDFQRFQSGNPERKSGNRYNDRKKRQNERKNRVRDDGSMPIEKEKDSTSDIIGREDLESDDLKEYSSPEESGSLDLRRRSIGSDQGSDSEPVGSDGDNQIELPPSIESSPNSDCDDYNKDQIDTEIIEALKAHSLHPEEEPLETLSAEPEPVIPQNASSQEQEAEHLEVESVEPELKNDEKEMKPLDQGLEKALISTPASETAAALLDQEEQHIETNNSTQTVTDTALAGEHAAKTAEQPVLDIQHCVPEKDEEKTTEDDESSKQ